MQLLSDPPSLAEVAEDFAHWRRTRTSPRTPEELQQKAVKLLERYRVNEVLKALGFCHKAHFTLPQNSGKRHHDRPEQEFKISRRWLHRDPQQLNNPSLIGS